MEIVVNDFPEVTHPKINGNVLIINEFTILSNGGNVLSLTGGIEYSRPIKIINNPIANAEILTYHNDTKPNIDKKIDIKRTPSEEVYL